ncbi:MAG: DUF6364 family protein [Bacteroidota bacterium]
MDLKNITLSLDEKVLAAGREYAKAHNMSLNALIRKLLAQTVLPAAENWVDEMLGLMDRAGGDSHGGKWTRAELYDV